MANASPWPRRVLIIHSGFDGVWPWAAEAFHMDAVRRRVVADEIALAADVFDVEPLPATDPLLSRHNVVHTPHNAGRTEQANDTFAQAIVDQFRPDGPG